MSDYTTLSQEIEAEYDAFCLDKSRNLNTLYEKLFILIKYKICSRIKKGNYVDEAAAEDLTQEVLLAIMSKGIYEFEKGEAMFVTYCSKIARNKAMDYVNKRNKRQIESIDDHQEVSAGEDAAAIYNNPERLVMEYEYRLELIEELKRYLKTMLNWPQAPYRTVASCFTTILFHKYHPKTKELGSPGWAYREVQDETVAESAERFIRELNEWLIYMRLTWGEDFYDRLDEEEEGCYVGDIVFSNRFTVKDFENWSSRLRSKVKKKLQEETAAEKRMSFELE